MKQDKTENLKITSKLFIDLQLSCNVETYQVQKDDDAYIQRNLHHRINQLTN